MCLHLTLLPLCLAFSVEGYVDRCDVYVTLIRKEVLDFMVSLLEARSRAASQEVVYEGAFLPPGQWFSLLSSVTCFLE